MLACYNANLRHLIAPSIRVGAWVTVLALIPLSLLPTGLLMRTEIGEHLEHVLAYGGATFVVAMARSERGILSSCLLLIAYAGGLEFLQRFSPGPTPSLRDFMFSAGGVVLVSAVVALLRRLPQGRRYEPKRP
jgi:VanZ family protein